MKLLKDFPESAHWYDASGQSRHDATLREARKEKLYPSVTSILGVKSKPGLQAWKDQELLLAALTLPRNPGESDQDFALRVMADSKKTASAAADTGNMIHAWAESYVNWMGGHIPAPDPVPDGFALHCAAIIEQLQKLEGQLVAEQSMVNIGLGYAGRIDLQVLDADGQAVAIVDFKTQRPRNGRLTFYPEWCAQVAAYGNLNPSLTYINIAISSDPLVPLVASKTWSQDEVKSGIRIFEACLVLWQEERGYRPIG